MLVETTLLALVSDDFSIALRPGDRWMMMNISSGWCIHRDVRQAMDAAGL